MRERNDIIAAGSYQMQPTLFIHEKWVQDWSIRAARPMNFEARHAQNQLWKQNRPFNSFAFLHHFKIFIIQKTPSISDEYLFIFAFVSFSKVSKCEKEMKNVSHMR